MAVSNNRILTGRRVIYTDVEEVNRSNVVEVLNKALETHDVNKGDIQYLYDYYKGKQPILNRMKDIRPEINNKIVENRANEIVSFKVGYLMGEPIQYVCRGDNNTYSDAINLLNEFVFSEDKASKDKELADWFTICGTSFRMVLPDAVNDNYDEAPFEIYTLDPRSSFVVYHTGLGNKRVMGVKYIVLEDSTVIYSVYTDKMYFEIKDDKIIKSAPHSLGQVPIIEYPANSARLGAFEIVLPLLDAINEIASNRLDGLEQFIQSILLLKGVDLDDEGFQKLRENGGLKVPLEGDAKYLVQELNQSQTQTLVDYMYQTVLTICGMPNRNGGTSTSDTGSAVVMRDGWSAAEARAKDTELMFKMAEKEFLKLAIHITNTLRNMDLKLSAIEIRFTRRNYENIQEKAQVLAMMLSSNKVHPLLAFTHCGMFTDPALAFKQSMEWYEEQENKMQKELDAISKHKDENEDEVEDKEEEDV